MPLALIRHFPAAFCVNKTFLVSSSLKTLLALKFLQRNQLELFINWFLHPTQIDSPSWMCFVYGAVCVNGKCGVGSGGHV